MIKKLSLALALIAAISVLTACGNKSKSDTDESAATDSGTGGGQNAVLPVGSEWIDPDFAKVLQAKGYIANAETVTPADVADIPYVNVSESELASLRGIEYFVSLKKLDMGGKTKCTKDCNAVIGVVFSGLECVLM